MTEEEEADRAHIVHMDLAEAFATNGIDKLDAQLEAVRKVALQDGTYMAAKAFTAKGWPRSKLEAARESEELAPYFKHRERLRVVDNLLLYGPRLVIPTTMVRVTLDRIHAAHQGETKTLESTQDSVVADTYQRRGPGGPPLSHLSGTPPSTISREAPTGTGGIEAIPEGPRGPV